LRSISPSSSSRCRAKIPTIARRFATF
jgi:hypothetical protein